MPKNLLILLIIVFLVKSQNNLLSIYCSNCKLGNLVKRQNCQANLRKTFCVIKRSLSYVESNANTMGLERAELEKKILPN